MSTDCKPDNTRAMSKHSSTEDVEMPGQKAEANVSDYPETPDEDVFVDADVGPDFHGLSW